MIAATPLAILAQAVAWGDEGEDVVLATIVAIHENSSRSVGAQMAIAGSGRSIGSFSGGCLDAAIVAEAVSTLQSGQARMVRYGAGSRFIDIRLPCGGGIDVLFMPHPSIPALRDAVAAVTGRKCHVLDVGSPALPFPLEFFPPLRIAAFGHGEDFCALVRLARAFGASIEPHTPDAAEADRLRGEGIAAERLANLTSLPALTGDPWTAFVFVFHERDWEDALLPQVIASPSLYCGAVGSRSTHAARLERLRALGCTDRDLERLRGHIGLIPATRDPATLAISILAEVAGCYAEATQVKAHRAVTTAG